MASWLLWLRKHCQRIRIPTCSDVFSPVQVVAASREEMTSQWTPSLWTSSLPLNSSQHLSSRTRSPRRRWGSTILPVFAPSLMTFDLSSPQRTFMKKSHNVCLKSCVSHASLAQLPMCCGPSLLSICCEFHCCCSCAHAQGSQ